LLSSEEHLDFDPMLVTEIDDECTFNNLGLREAYRCNMGADAHTAQNCLKRILHLRDWPPVGVLP
jgi:hypothetical protein